MCGRVPGAEGGAQEEEGEKELRGGQALAEVVVCAVGRVVTLPLVEMTAQSTALPALGTDDGGARFQPPCAFLSSPSR